MKYDVLLLDLDGTLTDPSEGITKCIAYALDAFGMQPEEQDALKRFIGPPLVPAFMEEYGVDKETAWAMLNKYRERFGDVGWRENEVYAGIPKMLSALKAAGVKLALATSKPEIYAKRIVEYFDLAGYLDFVGGSDMQETRATKADVIKYVLAEMGISDVSRVAMVGDRKHDCEGAAVFGMDSIGVLWGFGDTNELETAGAKFIAATPEELVTIVRE